MIKNEFQKIYRKIISQAPIFDTFEDNVIKPRAVKFTDQYYIKKLERERFFTANINSVANNIGKRPSGLLYYYFKPLLIFDPYKSKDLDLLNIETRNAYDYNTITEGSSNPTYDASIGLHISIVELQDFEYLKKSNIWNPIYFISNDVQDDSQDFINYYNYDILDDYSRYVQQYYEDDLNSEYKYDITKGCILVAYAITNLVDRKELYFDYDIYENKKFFPGNTPNNKKYLKYNFMQYFNRSSIINKIKNVLTQKLIEIKNNY